jgi:hypothetical protein
MPYFNESYEVNTHSSDVSFMRTATRGIVVRLPGGARKLSVV